MRAMIPTRSVTLSTARIEHIEQVRALEAEVIGCQDWYPVSLSVGSLIFAHQSEQCLTLLLVETEMLPQLCNIGMLEVVGRELHLFLQSYFAIGDGTFCQRITCPHNVIDRIDVLQDE